MCACLQLARILWLLALRYSLALDMAVYVVSSLLRPDGTVQTTSQVTLDQFPSLINGNEAQLFVQTHSLVHLRNVQTHSSSRNIWATQDRPSDSVLAHQFLADLELGLRRGEWTHCGLRTHEDRRRPRSPSIPPVRQVASTTVDLIHLPVRTLVPSLGSPRFVLCSGSRIEEIAILIDDVLY